MTTPAHLQYEEYLRSLGAVAIWPLNETGGPDAFDVSGNDFHGTHNNVLYRAEPFSDTLVAKYDGATSYTNVLGAGLQAAWGTNDGAIMAWFKVENYDVWSDGIPRFITHFYTNANNETFLRRNNLFNDRIRYEYYAAGSGVVANYDFGTGPTTWVCLVLAWDRSDFVRLYVNGVRVGDHLLGNVVWAGALVSALIGSENTTPDNVWYGAIAYVSIFDTSLTETQIAAMSEEPMPEPPPSGIYAPRSGSGGSHDSGDDGDFSLVVWRPSFAADGSNVIYRPKGTLVDEITYKIDAYRHEIRRYGGYWSASIDMKMPPQDAETWFMEGLGWHIVVLDSYLEPTWEGFINEMTYSIGGFQATRGPLADICNRCSVTYSILDTGSSPPDVGSQTTTIAADFDASKLKFGIWDKILTAGSMDNSAGVLEADQLRDAYLAENNYPETSQRVTLFGQQSGHNLHLECLGYNEFLKFPFNDLTAGVVTVSTKIASILDADPNSLFSSANADIEDNAVITHAWEDENNIAWDLLLELAKMGGAAYEPFNLGVYGGRHVVYESIPTAVEYFQVLRDNRMIIETATGDEVKPWRVLPGKWKMLRDFLVGRVPGGVPLREDPRMALIESVVFAFPNSLTITSNKVDTVKQRLGQAGLFGIGV